MSCSLVLPTKVQLACEGNKFSVKKTLKYFRTIGQLKKQIELQYYAFPESCDSTCKEELRIAVEKINREFSLLQSIFPPVFQKIKNLEHELEYQAKQLLKELKAFLTNLMIQILDKVISLLGIDSILNLPIPFLGSTTLIDENGKPYQYSPRILDFFTKEGKAKIKAALRDRQEDVTKFFSAIDKQITDFFTGEWNLIIPEYNIEELWQRFVTWVNRTLNDFVNSIITALIKLIDSVVPLPGFLKVITDPTKALEKVFDDIWAAAKKQYQSIRNRVLEGNLGKEISAALMKQANAIIDTLIDTLLKIGVPIFGTLGDILGFGSDLVNGKVISKEKILADIKNAWNDLMQDIRDFFTKDWFKKITDWLYNTISSVLLDILKNVPIIGAFIRALTLIMDIVTGKVSECTAMEFIMKVTGIPILSMADRIYSLIPSCITVEYKEGGYMPKLV